MAAQTRPPFRGYLLENTSQPADRLLADLVVRYEPVSHQLQPGLPAQLDEARVAAIHRREVQPQHVGLDGVLHPAAEVRPQLPDAPGRRVRAAQEPALAARPPPEGHVDGDAGGGRDDARLPQAAADRLAHPPRVPDRAPGPDDYAADGRA